MKKRSDTKDEGLNKFPEKDPKQSIITLVIPDGEMEEYAYRIWKQWLFDTEPLRG